VSKLSTDCFVQGSRHFTPNFKHFPGRVLDLPAGKGWLSRILPCYAPRILVQFSLRKLHVWHASVCMLKSLNFYFNLGIWLRLSNVRFLSEHAEKCRKIFWKCCVVVYHSNSWGVVSSVMHARKWRIARSYIFSIVRHPLSMLYRSIIHRTSG